MLSIHVERNAEHSEVAIDEDEVTVGRDPGNVIVLRDPEVSRKHCRIFERDGAWWVVDLGSERGTYVNGRRIAVATALKETDRVHVGPCVLSIEIVPDTLDEPGTQLSDHRRRVLDAEGTLLADIQAGDDTSRAVYADWLEQQSRFGHAEFLRLQLPAKQAKAADAAIERTTARLRELAATLEIGWRMKVARPLVEGCGAAFEASCPGDWGALAATADPAVRSCGTCKRFVHYCVTEEEAFAQSRRGAIVALDIAVVREPVPQRAEIQCPRCGRINTDTYKFCLGCAADLAPPAAVAAASSGPDPAAGKPRAHAHTVSRNTIPRRPPSSPNLEEQLTAPRASSAGLRTSAPDLVERPVPRSPGEPARPRPPTDAPAPPEPAPTARPSAAPLHLDRAPESLGEPATIARPSSVALPRALGEPATTARPSSAPRAPVEDEPFLDASDSFAGEQPTNLMPGSPPRLTGEQPTTAWTGAPGEPLTTARPGSPMRLVEPAAGDDDEQATVARPSARRPPTDRPSAPAKRGPQICATCASPAPASFVFCGTCGARMR